MQTVTHPTKRQPRSTVGKLQRLLHIPRATIYQLRATGQLATRLSAEQRQQFAEFLAQH